MHVFPNQVTIGVTERLRSLKLNLGKAIAMAFCPLIFILVLSARSMHDVACEFACKIREILQKGVATDQELVV